MCILSPFMVNAFTINDLKTYTQFFFILRQKFGSKNELFAVPHFCLVYTSKKSGTGFFLPAVPHF